MEVRDDGGAQNILRTLRRGYPYRGAALPELWEAADGEHAHGIVPYVWSGVSGE